MKSKLFRYGMYWRIFYGALRTVLGLVLLKLINVPFSELLYRLLGQEVIEDPSDFLFTTANYFLQLHPLSVTYFLSAYLIFWGITDIFLSICLLKHRLWAFPVSLGLIVLFVLYELYRFTHTHSLMLLGVICIDGIIFWLIHREYRKTKLQQHKPPGLPEVVEVKIQ